MTPFAISTSNCGRVALPNYSEPPIFRNVPAFFCASQGDFLPQPNRCERSARVIRKLVRLSQLLGFPCYLCNAGEGHKAAVHVVARFGAGPIVERFQACDLR